MLQVINRKSTKNERKRSVTNDSYLSPTLFFIISYLLKSEGVPGSAWGQVLQSSISLLRGVTNHGAGVNLL
jgi:hypothetical protein